MVSLGLNNAISYDIIKTEAILFIKAWNKKAKEEILATRLVFGEQQVRLNNQTTR